MAAILALSCRRCGHATDTKHSRDAICFNCLVEGAVRVDLNLYEALWAKRQRYGRHGAVPNEAQLMRVVKRINTKVHAMVTSGDAVEIFNRLLADARQRAQTVGGRIYVTDAIHPLSASQGLRKH